jgi:hypothetical protein
MGMARPQGTQTRSRGYSGGPSVSDRANRRRSVGSAGARSDNMPEGVLWVPEGDRDPVVHTGARRSFFLIHREARIGRI